MPQVRAKQNFYHDLVGNRAQGDVFNVVESTFQALQQAGYVESLDSQAHSAVTQAAQEAMQRQQEMGQAQAKANEEISQARHIQNVTANQHTQQVEQEIKQRAEQNGADHTNEADQKATEQQQKHFNPAAVSPKATAKKANENK